jgi:hypothetical protein
MISDERLAQRYEYYMSNIVGMQISASKTFQSFTLAQFAGFNGISDNGNVTVFRPFKHGRDFVLDGKELNLLHALGAKALPTKQSKSYTWWREKLDSFCRTRSWRNPDLSPLIPDQPSPVKYSKANLEWLASLSEMAMSKLQMNYLLYGHAVAIHRTRLQRWQPGEPFELTPANSLLTGVVGERPFQAPGVDSDLRSDSTFASVVNQTLHAMVNHACSRNSPFTPEQYSASVSGEKDPWDQSRPISTDPLINPKGLYRAERKISGLGSDPKTPEPEITPKRDDGSSFHR